MSSIVEDYLYNGADPLIGSFSDAKILSNGEIVLAPWNSGNIGMGSGVKDRNYPFVLEDGVTIRNIILPGGNRLITSDLLVSQEKVQNYSGVSVFNTGHYDRVGLIFSCYKSQYPSFVVHYRYKSGVVSQTAKYLSDLRSNYDQGVIRPPEPEPDNFFWGGAYGGCVSDLNGRAYTWVSNGLATDNSSLYDTHLAIYEDNLSDYYYSNDSIILSRSCRTANILPNGNILFLCGSHAVIYDVKYHYVDSLPGLLSSFLPLCSTVHPNSGNIYFNSNHSFNSAIYCYDFLTNKLVRYNDPNINILGQYWTMQPIPSEDMNIDKMVMFPGLDATENNVKIVEFNNSTQQFTYYDDINIGNGFGCSSLTSDGYILVFPLNHGIVKKYTPDTPYNWSNKITNSIFMTGK